MPTARHGSLTSSLYVAEKESSNEAILAGTAKLKFTTVKHCMPKCEGITRGERLKTEVLVELDEWRGGGERERED
jgi:hypothetical protein